MGAFVRAGVEGGAGCSWRPECLGPWGAGGQEREEREFTSVERRPRTRHSPRLSPTGDVGATPSVIISTYRAPGVCQALC